MMPALQVAPSQHQTEQHYLDGARWRKDVAEKELDRLGPIGRRTHRHQRRELENRIARFDNEITRHETQLDRLGRAFETITPDVVDRAAWEHDHRDDLDQLAVAIASLKAVLARESPEDLRSDQTIEIVA